MRKAHVFKAVSLLIGLHLVFSGCNQHEASSGDPKRQLTDYISRSFDVHRGEDREKLIGFLTGDAKTRLSAWSEDQFLQAFAENRRHYIKLTVQETKQISPSVVDITYELTFLDQNKGRDAKVTNRKLAELKLEQGQWLISEVKNLKELVEYRNEMSLP